MYAGSTGVRRGVEEGLHELAAVAGALEGREQVDVQVGQVIVQDRQQPSLRPVVQGDHLLINSHWGHWRDRVAICQAVNPANRSGMSSSLWHIPRASPPASAVRTQTS